MVNDLISDLITRIKNAGLKKHTYTYAYYSKINCAILDVLKDENYIKTYLVENLLNKKYIKIYINYYGNWNKLPFFTNIIRVSKPGHRIFCGYKNFEKKIPLLKKNKGVLIISTSLGVMSSKKAQQYKVGGELICYIE